jgi:hypothetical protein
MKANNQGEGIVSFSQLLLRFMVGGSVVTGASVLAQVAGTGLAGRFMTGPWMTGVSLYFVYVVLGTATAAGVAKAGLPGLIPVAAFLACMWWAFSRGTAFWPAFGLSFSVWTTGMLIMQFANRRMMPAMVAVLAASALVQWIRTDFAWKWFRYEDPRTGELRDSEYRIGAAIAIIPPVVVAAVVLAIDFNIKHALAGSFYTVLAIFVMSAFFRPVATIITGKPIRP